MATRKSPRRTSVSSPPPESAAAPLAARYEISDERPRRVAETPPAWTGTAPTSVVTATEAARRFSDLINRACYQSETFVIERGGRPLCQLGPLQGRPCTGADLLALLSRLPRPDEEYLAVLEGITRNQAPVEDSPWER